MTLYEIDRAIMDCVDADTGEILDTAALDSLQMERTKKIENIACYIKNLRAEANAIAAEIDVLKKRKAAAKSRAERLSDYLLRTLSGEKFNTAKASISYRKSESVCIQDMSQIPDKYLVYTDPEANKKSIKEAIKAGGKVPGAIIVENVNVQVR